MAEGGVYKITLEIMDESDPPLDNEEVLLEKMLPKLRKAINDSDCYLNDWSVEMVEEPKFDEPEEDTEESSNI